MRTSHGTSIAERMSLLTVYTGSRMLMRGKVEVRVEGLEYVSRSGPVLIVARHFHHLYDGCVLLGTIPRRLHILVALDWVQRRWLRWLMEWACTMVEWPALLRVERLNEDKGNGDQERRSAYTRDESGRYLRRVAMDAVRLLRRGEALVAFPEGYPTIDPESAPQKDPNGFLPFRIGFAKLVEMAERDGHTRVAIVPAGFHYVSGERWHVTLRFGPAVFRDDYPDAAELVRTIEMRVRELSQSVAGSAPISSEEAIQL